MGTVLHAGELIAHLDLPKKRLPSRSTFYVTLHRIGIEGLEGKIAEMGTAMERENRASESLCGADGAALRGLATDGKDLRGARAHGDLSQAHGSIKPHRLPPPFPARLRLSDG